MPPAKRRNFKQRPVRTTANATLQAIGGNEAAQMSVPQGVRRITAVKRQQLFARLLWLEDYAPILAAEREMSGPLLELLKMQFTSAYTRELIQSGTAAGERADAAVEARLGDCIGFLDRARNRLHIPFAQVPKAISLLAGGTTRPIWVAERKARRVVGRQYAIDSTLYTSGYDSCSFHHEGLSES